MWYNTTKSLDGCPKFKEKVFKIFKERLSRMREESFKKISKYITKNTTKNKAIYVIVLVDPVIKSERTIITKKRDAIGEILFVSQSFENDEIICLSDV